MKNLLNLSLLFVFIFSYSQSSYCDGWEKGYQKGLDSCLKVAITPTCPLPEIGANSYNDGYGMGYAKAKQICNSTNNLETQVLPNHNFISTLSFMHLIRRAKDQSGLFQTEVLDCTSCTKLNCGLLINCHIFLKSHSGLSPGLFRAVLHHSTF